MAQWFSPEFILPAVGSGVLGIAMWVMRRPSEGARTSIEGFQALSRSQSAYLERLASDLKHTHDELKLTAEQVKEMTVALRECREHHEACEARCRELDSRLRILEGEEEGSTYRS